MNHKITMEVKLWRAVSEEDYIEPETLEVLKLEPSEISDYVNSLKDIAKYWYDTFFPMQSENLNTDEKLKITLLNMIKQLWNTWNYLLKELLDIVVYQHLLKEEWGH